MHCLPKAHGKDDAHSVIFSKPDSSGVFSRLLVALGHSTALSARRMRSTLAVLAAILFCSGEKGMGWRIVVLFSR